MAVSETWLSVNIPSDVVNVAKFNFFRKDRERTGGGVGVYVKN